MKRYAKIRLSVFLCIMLVLPSIISVLPMTATEAVAATNVSLYWNYNTNAANNAVIQVEKGEKFNIGDYAYVWLDVMDYGCASQYKGVKYSSNKKSVLAVNSKGIVTAKKTGKATLTIKYKGKTITKKFQVVKAGTFKDTAAVKGLRKKVDKLSKNMPSEITLSNGYKYLKMLKDYNAYTTKHNDKFNRCGMLLEYVQLSTFGYLGNTGKFAVPQSGRFCVLDQMLYQYADKHSPTSTRSSKQLKIASASATTTSIKVKLKQKVNASHILAAHIENSYLNETVDKKKANVNLTIYDKTADKYYSGIGTIKKGSKIMTIKLITSTYDAGSQKYVDKSAKLKKGHTYVIGRKDTFWGNEKTVKVK